MCAHEMPLDVSWAFFCEKRKKNMTKLCQN